jgi:putative hydrolase of the HAD superfamily
MSVSIEAVIFDLGGVLIGIELEELRRHPETEKWAEIIPAIRSRPETQLLNSGRISPDAFYHLMRERLNLPGDFEEFRRAWCGIFVPRPRMEAWVRCLAERMPVGLLSDTEPMHWEYLRRRFEFLGVFKRPVLSFEVGAVKPAAVMYRAAAESVGVPAERCLFVDDLPENAEGARRAGMQAVVFENIEQAETALKQVLKLPAAMKL